eukprot:699124-Prymnesium_polylepis.1
MTQGALKFIAMKDAARLAKAANKAAKVKERGGGMTMLRPFQVGSICRHGHGRNRRPASSRVAALPPGAWMRVRRFQPDRTMVSGPNVVTDPHVVPSSQVIRCTAQAEWRNAFAIITTRSITPLRVD